MKTIKAYISTTILGSFIMLIAMHSTSCKKDRVPAKTTGNFASPTSFYDQYKQEEQVFEIDSLSKGPLFGKMGTQLFPDKTIFMNPDGTDFNYPYLIKLIEIYSAKDMILSNMPSIASQTILETGGEIRVRAFKDAQELVLRPNKKFHMELDSTTSLLTAMSVYYGFPNNSITDWTNNLTSLDPKIAPDNLSSVVNTPFFYSMNIGRMGWVSCAKLHDNTNPTGVISFTAEGSNTQNIDIFLVFANIHSVMKVHDMKSYSIPLGTQFTVIAIAKDVNKNNALVYDMQNITMNSVQQRALTLVETTDANLISVLSAFK